MEIPFLSATRRNHAVEHATVAILLRRRGRPVGVAGHSDPRGFTLRGNFTASEVESAANEAVRRLGAGEAHLAVTPMCGTNLATSALLAGGAALLAGGNDRRSNWTLALCASLAAMLFAGRIGLGIQERVTTDADVGATSVTGVRARRGGGGKQVVRVSLRR